MGAPWSPLIPLRSPPPVLPTLALLATMSTPTPTPPMPLTVLLLTTMALLFPLTPPRSMLLRLTTPLLVVLSTMGVSMASLPPDLWLTLMALLSLWSPLMLSTPVLSILPPTPAPKQQQQQQQCPTPSQLTLLDQD